MRQGNYVVRCMRAAEIWEGAALLSVPGVPDARGQVLFGARFVQHEPKFFADLPGVHVQQCQAPRSLALKTSDELRLSAPSQDTGALSKTLI